jgi:hypothetical protein
MQPSDDNQGPAPDKPPTTGPKAKVGPQAAKAPGKRASSSKKPVDRERMNDRETRGAPKAKTLHATKGNWPLIHGEFVNGWRDEDTGSRVYPSIGALAVNHGLSKGTIGERARDGGWVEEREAAQAELARAERKATIDATKKKAGEFAERVQQANGGAVQLIMASLASLARKMKAAERLNASDDLPSLLPMLPERHRKDLQDVLQKDGRPSAFELQALLGSLALAQKIGLGSIEGLADSGGAAGGVVWNIQRHQGAPRKLEGVSLEAFKAQQAQEAAEEADE